MARCLSSGAHFLFIFLAVQAAVATRRNPSHGAVAPAQSKVLLHSQDVVATALDMSRSSVMSVPSLPPAEKLQDEAKTAQEELLSAIHRAEVTEARRVAARALTRFNAGFASAFSKVAVLLDQGVHQSLPSVDITQKHKVVSQELSRRATATHAITHAMAYLANYTLNYTYHTGIAVFDYVQAAPESKPFFSFDDEPSYKSDSEFQFDAPTGQTDTDVVPFEPVPLGAVQVVPASALAHQATQEKLEVEVTACKDCPKCAQCLEATAEQYQNLAIDKVQDALAAEVKRMGAAVFSAEPKAAVEFLCKFQEYARTHRFLAEHPMGHPADHEPPIASDKSTTFRASLLQRRETALDAQQHAAALKQPCPEAPPSQKALDDTAHALQDSMVDVIILAQFYEVQRAVGRGVSRLSAAVADEGSAGHLKAFDEGAWSAGLSEFRSKHPTKRWNWSWKKSAM